MKVLVVGAGIGGLGTALALGRAGHDVTVLERDGSPMPADPASAFELNRRGVPQARHSHAMLARLRNHLRDHYPDVLEALLDAGALETPFSDNLPPTLAGHPPQPGDEDLVAMSCRRSTLEWVLRRIVERIPNVSLLNGHAVTGLVAQPGSPPTITGVRLDGGSQLSADLVVVALGSRADLRGWLRDVGAEIEEEVVDAGMIYISRFYRMHDGVEINGLGTSFVLSGGDLGFMRFAVFGGDNRTLSMTFWVPTHDGELRARLLDSATFDRVAAVLADDESFADPMRLEPISPVYPMAGLINRLRRFTDHEGSPLVLGLHAVGDAHTVTNPHYGRGCSLAMVQATLLADSLAAHPDDPEARARAYEAACVRDVEPWFRFAVATDSIPLDGTSPLSALAPVVLTDIEMMRAGWRMINLLAPPDELFGNAELMSRVLAAYAEQSEGPPVLSTATRSRDELLTSI